jgi:hypothetical protein
VSDINRERGRIGALSRSREADDPELVEARRTLAALRLAEHAQKIVKDWPPLTDAQIDNVIATLRAGA